MAHRLAVERDGAAQQRRGLNYAALQAHGLREPQLVEHAAFIEPLAPARAASPPEREAAVQLVKNEAGRWELTRALGELEPPPAALKRPGAEAAAAQRKRKLEAQVEARVAAPGSVFDLTAVAGAAASEKDAEAAARARLKERRLAELAKARRGASTPPAQR